MITKNYGLAGGTLDSTKHIERAIERGLLTPEEAHRWQGGLNRRLMLRLATYPGKQNPGAN